MTRCVRPHPRGWVCIIDHSDNVEHEPCGLVPAWWNLIGRWRFRRFL